MVILVLLGSLGMTLRYVTQRRARLSPGDQTYRLRFLVDFEAEQANTTFQLTLPRDTRSCRIYRESILHPGLTSIRFRSPRTRDHVMAVEAVEKGGYTIVSEFDIHVSPKAPWRDETVNMTTDVRAYYLRAEPHIQSADATVRSLIKEWKSQRLTSEQLLARIYEHCAELRSDDDIVDAAAALSEGAATPSGRAAAMVALCRAAKIPARLVSGVDLQQATTGNQRVETRVWVEVFFPDRWVPFDPESRFAHELPASMLPIRRDGTRFTRVEHGVILLQRMTLQRIPPPRGLTDAAESPWMIFDLTRMPLPTQRTLALLLVLPIGALVTAVARVMIGIPTFGTFTPALLALSFVYAAWSTGIVILIGVVLIGIVGRRWLDHLKLLVVPRLGVILTMVVLSVIFIMSLLDYTRLTAGPQAALLPIVILTMLVERLYITGEEDGVGFTLKRVGGTAMVALCCFVLMQAQWLGEFLVTFPEVHLITAALLVGVGRYAGYRLTELWRFHDMVQLARSAAAKNAGDKLEGDQS